MRQILFILLLMLWQSGKGQEAMMNFKEFPDLKISATETISGGARWISGSYATIEDGVPVTIVPYHPKQLMMLITDSETNTKTSLNLEEDELKTFYEKIDLLKKIAAKPASVDINKNDITKTDFTPAKSVFDGKYTNHFTEEYTTRITSYLTIGIFTNAQKRVRWHFQIKENEGDIVHFIFISPDKIVEWIKSNMENVNK